MPALPFDPTDPAVVLVDYTDFQGRRDLRRILPIKLHFGKAELYPEAQWLLEAWDVERVTQHTFAMAGVHAWDVGDRPA